MSNGKAAETILCYGAGALFSAGWWLWIDATAFSQTHPIQVVWWHYVAGLISTLGLIGVNIVSWSDLDSNAIFGDQVSSRAKVFLFIAFIVCFIGLIAAAWIGIQYYFVNKDPNTSAYGGVAIIIQNILIFVSTIMYRFSKAQDEDSF